MPSPPSSSPPANLAGLYGRDGSDPFADIAEVKGHTGWHTRFIAGLAAVYMGAVGWIFYSIYEPMKDLRRDVAVQTEASNAIREDIREIRDDFRNLETSQKPDGDETARNK